MRPVSRLALCCLLVTCTPAAAEQGATTRPDGSTIHWTLDLPPGRAGGLLVVAQGSGCAPAAQNPAIAAAWTVAPHLALLRVEKYGVTPSLVPAGPEDCPADYWANHTVSQRAADYATVIADLGTRAGLGERLVLFGGSEGGAAIARLAAAVDADAVVLYSTGLGEPLLDSIKRVIPPHAAAEADAALAAARANPTGGERWGGNSYLWWADVADAILIKEALASAAPILLVQGERDPFAPVQSARAAAAIAAGADGDLTYWELPGYDHFMVDAAGVDHRAEVFARIAEWIAARR
jgi:pimeloyl-ACP methyl ester carboxylesterase